jgi:histidyl-tRNA synthetase
VISALLGAMDKMGLQPSHVELRLNDRRILNGLLHHLGVPGEAHDSVMVVIDKREKIPPENLQQMLLELGLKKAQLRKLDAFFAAAAEGLPAVRRRLGKSSDATAELEKLVALLGKIGLGEFVTVDCTVVRGLSYYTGPVFEVRDRGGKFRALCGGGRYDGLLSALGGESIPAVGFGFGDVVILELLEKLNLLPKLGKEIDFAIIPFSEREAPVALEVGQRLRRMGYRADTDFSYRKLKRALQRAEQIGARSAVMLMPEELSRGELVVRNMAMRSENRVKVGDFLADPAGREETPENLRPPD